MQIKEMDLYLHIDSCIFIFLTDAAHLVYLLLFIHLSNKSFSSHIIDKGA